MKIKLILSVLVFATNASFAQQQPVDDIELFNQQMTAEEVIPYQDQLDEAESGGDTNEILDFEPLTAEEYLPQTDGLPSHILDVAGSVGLSGLQSFVTLKTKNRGAWASQFIFISKSNQRTILSSMNANTSIKPASTLKLFTGYLAFLEKSYSQTNLSSMLHRSDNVMADAALRSVAVKKGLGKKTQDETLDAGVGFMKSFYKNLEDSSKFNPVNGSGLNTTGVDSGDDLNKATARIETHLLEKIIKDGNFDGYKKLLAQPGQFGTLNRHLHQVSRLGKVYAKTGTLAKTKALAGYVQTKNGIMVFSIIGDQLKISPKDAFSVIEQIVLKHVQVAVTLK
jgi:D-alanyl-D-alanine carboxypeptidase